MSWLDLVLIMVIVGCACGGVIRGFGKAALDALFLYGALWAADLAAPALAAQIKLGDGAAVNHADADALLFIVFGGLALMIARWVYGMTLIDLGMFDKLLGMCAGLAAGMVIAHGIVHPVVMADPRGNAGGSLVASSTVGNEMLDFPTYHSVMDTLTGANTYRQSLPAGVGK
jgi:uncharacterized membrane protein required for colicin V production